MTSKKKEKIRTFEEWVLHFFWEVTCLFGTFIYWNIRLTIDYPVHAALILLMAAVLYNPIAVQNWTVNIVNGTNAAIAAYPVEHQQAMNKECLDRMGYGRWHGYDTGNWWGTKIICTNTETNQTLDLE